MNTICLQVVHIVNAAIRIDHNPVGVYFFTHALATYRHVHVMHLDNLQAEAQRGSRPRPSTTLLPLELDLVFPLKRKG